MEAEEIAPPESLSTTSCTSSSAEQTATPVISSPGKTCLITSEYPKDTYRTKKVSGLQYLEDTDYLVIRRRYSLLEGLTGWEAEEKYGVKNKGRTLYTVIGDIDGCETHCWKVINTVGHEMFRIYNPIRCETGHSNCCPYELEVSTPEDKTIGYMVQDRDIESSESEEECGNPEGCGTEESEESELLGNGEPEQDEKGVEEPEIEKSEMSAEDDVPPGNKQSEEKKPKQCGPGCCRRKEGKCEPHGVEGGSCCCCCRNENEDNVAEPKFTIQDPERCAMLKVEGPCCACKILTEDMEFALLSHDGNSELGNIVKLRPGNMKERCVDVDSYRVSYPLDLSSAMKAMVVGACFFLDFLYFAKSGC